MDGDGLRKERAGGMAEVLMHGTQGTSSSSSGESIQEQAGERVGKCLRPHCNGLEDHGEENVFNVMRK